MNEQATSMFLFARPSFIEGMARVVDFGGTLNEYNSSLNEVQADRLAFQADMTALKNDIAEARMKLRKQIENGTKEP